MHTKHYYMRHLITVGFVWQVKHPVSFVRQVKQTVGFVRQVNTLLVL